MGVFIIVVTVDLCELRHGVTCALQQVCNLQHVKSVCRSVISDLLKITIPTRVGECTLAPQGLDSRVLYRRLSGSL